jgi:hypothetical protein
MTARRSGIRSEGCCAGYEPFRVRAFCGETDDLAVLLIPELTRVGLAVVPLGLQYPEHVVACLGERDLADL